MRNLYESRRRQEEEDAKVSFDRCQRDMELVAKRHFDLTIQMDQEAQESKQHLASLQADIQNKTMGHNESIKRIR